MSKVRLSFPGSKIEGEIQLGGSKSISNRALLIQALCKSRFEISNLSDSDDTATLQRLLSQSEGIFDAGHAGTTFRFLTAYFAFKDGSQILTGSSRMKQRPIGVLVDALNNLGADIEYLENTGYPPLKINNPHTTIKNKITVSANTSSQYISALLMLAPALPEGLQLTLEGEIVSRPYLLMTLSIMKHFGIDYSFEDNTIIIQHQDYVPKSFFVEADWSAASYYYSMAAIAKEAKIVLHGLSENRIQGDSYIAELANHFGVTTSYDHHKITIEKNKDSKCDTFFEHDFIEQPDIAQTVMTMCAAKEVSALLTGLQTLYIKETDRILAFKTELIKVGVSINKVPKRFKEKDNREFFMLDGKINIPDNVSFDTYHDHRMAMALAPLGILKEIIINDAEVVSKSYPKFWEDLQSLGFEVL